MSNNDAFNFIYISWCVETKTKAKQNVAVEEIENANRSLMQRY